LTNKNGRTKTGKSVKGVAKASHTAKQIQAKRTKRAKTVDSLKTAKKTYPMTPSGVEKWKKNPRRSDLEGIDTKKTKKSRGEK